MTQPITELYKKQISLTEWFEQIDHENVDAFRKEDNEKRDRLGILHEVIGLPYDRPAKFSGRDVVDRSEAFRAFLEKEGAALCALRLIPLEEGLPKLRMRGHSLREVLEQWLPNQTIDADKYRAEVVPHSEQNYWSTIFVVNKNGVFGEIVADGHHVLTQGFYGEKKPILFWSDFETLHVDPSNEDARAYVEELIQRLHVGSVSMQKVLMEEIGATFANGYLCGYFESVHSDQGTWFIDYNRVLGQMYETYQIVTPKEGDLVGQVGNKGYAEGRVRIIEDPTTGDLEEDEILVCDMTTPAYLPLMKKAGAIITNRGGILSHAAITARELGKPCIVGTGTATSDLRDGSVVEVHAFEGYVLRLT